jgi:dGTPase
MGGTAASDGTATGGTATGGTATGTAMGGTAKRSLAVVRAAGPTPAPTERMYPDPEDPLRSPFEVDRHRIITCTAFRRLEGKTQVFVAGRHDHFRTRLTHTLEVGHIARTLARVLNADETLTEAIALAHDLGHPPFGHAGETALDELLAGIGGFNHNAHSIRVVTYLEHPFPPYRGLNLTHATLEGLAAHATRYDAPLRKRQNAETSKSQEDCRLPIADCRLAEGPSVEAQIASLADRIAYDCHDLEDAIGAGFIQLNDLSGLEIWRRAYEKAASQWKELNIFAIRRPVLDTMLHDLLTDAFQTTKSSMPADAGCTVDLSPSGESLLAELEQFLAERIYRHPEVVSSDRRGQQMIRALFAAYREDARRLPERFAARINDQGVDRVIGDYIAGMTDRFCRREFRRRIRRSSL